MGIFKRKNSTVAGVKLVQQQTANYFTFNGNLFQSDIIRACIRPDVKAVGKSAIKHIRNYNNELKVNPEPYIKFMLAQPNQWMTMQQLLEQTVSQYLLNNNAFILINRDDNGLPYELYPINAVNVQAVFSNDGFLFYKFMMKNGRTFTFSSSNIIHLKSDVYDNDIFGKSSSEALFQVMEIIQTTDQGIINAIKNSSVVRWLLKFNTKLKDKDLVDNTKKFVQNFLNINSDDDVTGAAAVDSSADATQIEPKDYVPNASQIKSSVERIYSYFNTNEKIVKSQFNENEWSSYYAAKIEPLLKQLSETFTANLFTRKEQAYGNSIYFEASNVQYASLQTKLNFMQMVDRGSMTPDEWRALFMWAPIEGGDKPVRRLDTQQVGKDGKTAKEGGE